MRAAGIVVLLVLVAHVQARNPFLSSVTNVLDAGAKPNVAGLVNTANKPACDQNGGVEGGFCIDERTEMSLCPAQAGHMVSLKCKGNRFIRCCAPNEPAAQQPQVEVEQPQAEVGHSEQPQAEVGHGVEVQGENHNSGHTATTSNEHTGGHGEAGSPYEHEEDAHESHACYSSVEAAIHCIHKFHIMIDAPHMWHDVHHHAQHSKMLEAYLQEQRQVLAWFKEASKATDPVKFPPQKLVAFEKSLKSTIAAAETRLTALQNAASTGAANARALASQKAAKLVIRLNELKETHAGVSKALAAAEKALLDGAKALEQVRVAFVTAAQPVIRALRSGAQATPVMVTKAITTLRSVSSTARTAIAPILSKGFKFLTSKGFGRAVIVVAAVLEGAEKWENSDAATTGGRIANTILAAAGAVLVMANPWVALADVALGYIPGGEQWKPSKFISCTGDALVGICEGLITKDTSMMSKVDANMKSGKCGIILQMANEAGQFWADNGLVGGLNLFWDDLGWAYDNFVSQFKDTLEGWGQQWKTAFTQWRAVVDRFMAKHVGGKVDAVRGLIGDVSNEQRPSTAISLKSLNRNGVQATGTYLKLKGCTVISGVDMPYFTCTAAGSNVEKPSRNTEAKDKRENGMDLFDATAKNPETGAVEPGFAMFWRDAPNRAVTCVLNDKVRVGYSLSSLAFWRGSTGNDKVYSNSKFTLSPTTAGAGRDAFFNVQLEGPKRSTCQVKYFPDVKSVIPA